MESVSQTYHYSPLGWGIWLYGPILAIFGIIVLIIWWTSLAHAVANSGIAVHGIGDWLRAAMCHSYRCDTFDYVLNSVLLLGFPFFASLLLFLSLLMMNSDRTAIISSNSVSISRGSFIRWGRQTLTKSDITNITTDSVMATMVFGNRSTSAGVRYNIGIVTAPTSSKKSQRIIIGLFPSETSAKESVKQIESLLK